MAFVAVNFCTAQEFLERYEPEMLAMLQDVSEDVDASLADATERARQIAEHYGASRPRDGTYHPTVWALVFK
jgi:hypothetical protein